MTTEEFKNRLAMAGRNTGPAMLFYAWTHGEIDRDGLRELAPLVWSLAEHPQLVLGQRRWVDLFRAAGFASEDGAAMPLEPVAVYRGSRTHGSRGGMAWSTNPAVSSWFARRNGASTIFAATIHPDHILAWITGRKEEELVVDPRHIRDLREIPALNRTGEPTIVNKTQAAILGSRAASHPIKYDRAKIRRLYGSGLSSYDVAAIVGCHPTTVCRVSRDLVEARAAELDAER